MALDVERFIDKWFRRFPRERNIIPIEEKEMKADLEEMMGVAKRDEWSRIAKDNHMNYPV